jgi:large subunit ribosomal protein L4
MEVVIANKKDEKVTLDKNIWSTKFESDVVAQAVNVYMSNQRTGTAKAKRRGEVDGGGRKPWKQKGTGRARHGSIRSPIWVGGGATFAPTGLQNFDRKMNKKANVLAITMVFSKHLGDKSLQFIELVEDAKSTDVRNLLSGVVNTGKKVLVISDNKKAFLALRNVENVRVVNSSNINVYDIARVSSLLVDTGAVESIEKILKI